MGVDSNRARQCLASLRESRVLGARVYIFDPGTRVASIWPKLFNVVLIDGEGEPTVAVIPTRKLAVGVILLLAVLLLTPGLDALVTSLAFIVLPILLLCAVSRMIRRRIVNQLLHEGVLTAD